MYNNYGNGGAYPTQEQTSRNLSQDSFRQAMMIAAQRMKLAKQAMPNAAYQYAQQHMMNTPAVRRQVNPYSIVANQNFEQGGMYPIRNSRRNTHYKGGGSIGTGPYWVPNPGIPTNPRYNQAAINQEAMYEPAPGTIGPPMYPTNPRYNQAAINQEAMYEPAPGTIGPPMYPTTPQPYNDGQVGMGVMAPQTPTPTFAPPAPTGPTIAEVTSRYQQPKVNQKDFGKAWWNEARNSGLKVFPFRITNWLNKMYTTNQEAMYEPAPGTIGPPMYPTTPQPYNDGQVGMGVMAPQTPTPTFAPPAPTGPTIAEVTSRYQQPKVNQKDFGKAWNEARNSGLKVFPFRNKMYTTDARTDVGKGAAEVTSRYQQPKVNQKDFGKAWNEARNSGLKVFPFRNKMYTTDARTDVGKGAAQKAVASMVQSNREYAAVADQRMSGSLKNNTYTVTPSSPVTQRQTQTNGNSVPWGKIAGAGVTTAVGMGILGLGTGAIKYPEGYMTPKEFIKDTKKNMTSKYMTPRELVQSMKKPKYPSNYMTPGEFTKGVSDKLKGMKTPQMPSYPSNYMTPGEFTKTMTDKLKSMKLPNLSYPQGYMTPKEFAKDVSSKLPKLKKPTITYPQGYMTPKDVKNKMANLKFPKINTSNIPERIGTKVYQVPVLRSSVKSADKVYKTMEKTTRKLLKRF